MNRNDTKLPDNGWTETLVREPDVGPPKTIHDILVSDYQCVEPSIIPLAELDDLGDIYEFLDTTCVMGREVLEFDIISLHDSQHLHESFLIVAPFRAAHFAQSEDDIVERADLPLAMVRLPFPLPQFRPR